VIAPHSEHSAISSAAALHESINRN
jgi:hypothetical protein